MGEGAVNMGGRGPNHRAGRREIGELREGRGRRRFFKFRVYVIFMVLEFFIDAETVRNDRIKMIREGRGRRRFYKFRVYVIFMVLEICIDTETVKSRWGFARQVGDVMRRGVGVVITACCRGSTEGRRRGEVCARGRTSQFGGITHRRGRGRVRKTRMGGRARTSLCGGNTSREGGPKEEESRGREGERRGGERGGLTRCTGVREPPGDEKAVKWTTIQPLLPY